MLSPFLIVFWICVLIFIDAMMQQHSSQGWSLIVAFFALCIMLAAVLLDILIKHIVKKRVVTLWIAELLILGGVLVFLLIDDNWI
jgi:predicted MFS family arabinose efflux permease